MIMRITRGKLHPGTWSAYEQAYKATVVAKSPPIEGLRGRWLGQDLHDLEGGYAGSLWDSVEAIRAYEQSDFYNQEILPTLQPFFVGDFTTTYCEVKVTRNARRPGRQSV
jgi:heme-degrading monooxygenase HmoA